MFETAYAASTTIRLNAHISEAVVASGFGADDNVANKFVTRVDPRRAFAASCTHVAGKFLLEYMVADHHGVHV